MKRYAVEISPQAEEEILEAAKFIALDSLRHAERWLDEIYEAVATLKTMPERCALIPENEEFEEDLRQLLFYSHRIIFLMESKKVRILHVRHSARDAWKP